MKNPVKRKVSSGKTQQQFCEFRCPYEDCSFFGKGLKKHLVIKHGWLPIPARKEISCRLKVWRYLSKQSHSGVYKPKVSYLAKSSIAYQIGLEGTRSECL